MPTALVLSLRPAVAAETPASLGRAAHAAILAQIAAADPALAARLHSQEGHKPLTVSNIMGLNGRGGRALVTPAQTYGLRVTLLCEALEALARDWTADGMGALLLDHLAWQVEGLTSDAAAHPWAGQISYEALATQALRLAGGAPRAWTLEFATPLTFRRGPVNQPLPLPLLVFGSLLDKWNAFAPLPLPAELRATIADLVVSEFDLRSQAAPTKGGAIQIGAVGRCAYRALGDGGAWLAGVDLLARFAFYSGVGAGTARGFGQTRLLGSDGAPPRARPSVTATGVAEEERRRT